MAGVAWLAPLLACAFACAPESTAPRSWRWIEGSPGDELKAEFFATEPPSAALDYIGESLVALQKQPKGPARYETHNVSFREQNGEAFVAWGKGAKEMRCTVQK